MIELRGESVGWDNEDEMHPKAKAAQKRMNSNLGCASFMLFGFVGMAIAGAAVIGLLNILRVFGK